MAYWIFKANPEHYRLAERLADPEPRTSWEITRFEDRIREGDLAFIWRTDANTKRRGFCALIAIDSNPDEFQELANEIPYQVVNKTAPRMRVHATYLNRFELISAHTLKEMPVLSGITVFRDGPPEDTRDRFTIATNYDMSDEEAIELLRLIAQQQLIGSDQLAHST